MVVADDHRHGPDAIPEQGFGVFPRRLLGELFREGVKHQMVKPRLGKQCLAFGQGVEKFQSVVFRIQDHPWMGVKTEQGSGRVQTLRNLLNLADDGTVSFVHAVEGAHRQHGPFGTLRGTQKLFRVVMHSHNANLGAVFRLGRTIFVPDLHA